MITNIRLSYFGSIALMLFRYFNYSLWQYDAHNLTFYRVLFGIAPTLRENIVLVTMLLAILLLSFLSSSPEKEEHV